MANITKRIVSSDLFSVERCPLDYYCSKSWDELATTEKQNIRICNTCASEVTLCETVEEFDEKAKEGGCVAYLVVKKGTELVVSNPLGIPKRK